MSEYNFPFTIAQVVDLLLLTVRRTKDSGDLDIDCPFCNKKAKLNTSARKNSFRCSVCETQGGMITLYGKIHNIDNSTAYREICELLKCGTISGKSKAGAGSGVKCNNIAPHNLPPETPKADRETVHQTYSMLLALLGLSNPHKAQLLARGLSESDIVKFKYKSVPAYGQQQLCERLIQSGCILEGVPGFYKYERGKWGVKLTASGLIIPVCGMDGKIEGMQIRLDNPLNGRKYIWLSAKEVPKGAIMGSGASSGSPIHFVGDPTAKRVFITEGALKGTVAHSITHYSFICLPGVNIGENTRKILGYMLETLKANGTDVIFEAFDMDKYENEYVGTAAKKLNDFVAAMGLKVQSATWADKSLKGIDDYYFHRWQEKQKLIYSVDASNGIRTAY